MDEILAWVLGFERDFDAVKERIDKALRNAEGALLRRIIADVLPRLGIKEGALLGTISNMARVNLIERVFNEMGQDEINLILKDYANELIGITGKNAAYYFALGFDREKVAAIAENSNLIRSIVGIGTDGELLKDGFLYRLGRSDAVRERVKQYVLTSIATKQDLKGFQNGLKVLIQGGKGVDGALVGYWNNFAYDAFAQVREVDNLHFKNEIGLRHFMYQGGIIITSRDFCIKKNGKVFSEQEAVKNWPNDPDLIDRKHKATYKPLIDRGRYNCRHFLMWISEEMYNERKALE